MVLLLRLLLPRLLLMPGRRLVVVVVVVPLLQLLLRLLLLHVVGCKLLAGELFEDRVVAGELVSRCCCYYGCFCHGCCYCRVGGWWWWWRWWYRYCNCTRYFSWGGELVAGELVKD